MKLVWTRFKYVGDIITWGLEEDCSHFAVQIGDEFFHSTMFKGFHVSTEYEFYELRTLVHEKYISLPENVSLGLRAKLLEDVDSIKYDYKFLLFLVWRAFLLKFFRRPLPNKIIENKNSDLCTEILNNLDGYTLISYEPNDVMTPHRLWRAVKDD